MGVAAAFLFVKHNRAGLAGQAKFLFDGFDGILEGFNLNPLVGRRLQTEREHELLGPRPTADGVDFVQCGKKVIAAETPQFVNGDVFIFRSLEQVSRNLLTPATLACLEDHDGPPYPSPRAVTSVSRIR